MHKPEPLPIPVHLNLNVRGLKPSATLAINEKCAALKAQGRQIFRLGLGQSPFPVPEPVVEELRVNAFQKDYLAVQGLYALRKAVADYQRRTHGVLSGPEDVLVGPGSKELMFLVQLVYYGDLVIPTPSWVSYAPQASILGRKVEWIPTTREHGWRLLPDDLEDFLDNDAGRPRLLILNYPNNPTGLSYSRAELQELARVAEQYKLIVISDEIYGELNFQGQHVSLAEFYPQGTIVSGGLSKWCGAGGWRLGTFTFPPDLRWLLQAMAVAASETFTSTSAPIQYAAVKAFEGGPFMDEYLADCRRILAALGGWISDRLNHAGVQVHPPEGGFYVLPDFTGHAGKLRDRGIATSRQLVEALLDDTGVAMLPASDFGRPPRELTVRMAFVDFEGGAALQAVSQIAGGARPDEAFLRKYCPNVLEAVDRIIGWLE